jgi:hypothetical protein
MTGESSRRTFLKLVAAAPFAAPFLAALNRAGFADSMPRIGRLMQEAQRYPQISERIDFISRALLGTRYAANTLIGGARRPEQFVLREDGFDCVTYSEVVWAAAIAADMPGFEATLKKIRYRNGVVNWHERNHYFADWCQRNVDNGLSRPVVIGDPVPIAKDVNSEPAVGRRKWTLQAMRRSTLLGSGRLLVAGDIVGFVSWRPNLDYFHTGFVAFGRKGELLLRHASSTRRRVIEEPMEAFFALNGAQYVTVLRPQEAPAVQAEKSAG